MSAEQETATIGQSIAEVYRAARADYADASHAARAGLAITAGGLAFEWGTGNEALLGMVGGNVHEATSNPALAGLATGGASLVEQVVFGVLMASTLANFPGVAEALRGPEGGNEAGRLSRWGRFLDDFVLGAAVSVAKENASRGHTFKQNVRRVLGSAAIIGAANTALIGAASTIARVGAEHGFENQADLAVKVVTNPWTYVTLFAGKLGYDKIKQVIQRRRDRHAVDNTPNLARGGVDYASYRSFCDERNGLMRTGVCDPEQYASIVASQDTMFALVGDQELPIITSSELFPLGSTTDDDSEQSSSALVPAGLFPDALKPGLTVMEQFDLEADAVDRILSSDPQDKMKLKDVPGLLIDKIEGRLVDGHGEPQFMVLAEYDMHDCDQMRDAPPTEVTTREGHTLTTDKEKILEHLPELVELHEAIFERQAAQIGYYDGLDEEMIRSLIEDDSFIGAAAFDKDTGKPFMFAIFGLGDEGAARIPWLNTRLVGNLTSSYGEDHALATPLVITARFNGLGVFSETVSLAMHEALYRTKAQSFDLLFSSNLQSILYTPRIINAALEQNGAIRKGCIIEASVLTRS